MSSHRLDLLIWLDRLLVELSLPRIEDRRLHLRSIRPCLGESSQEHPSDSSVVLFTPSQDQTIYQQPALQRNMHQCHQLARKRDSPPQHRRLHLFVIATRWSSPNILEYAFASADYHSTRPPHDLSGLSHEVCITRVCIERRDGATIFAGWEEEEDGVDKCEGRE